MNKDLDDRLIPNGEYRDAQNISVGKSEADDIGALETVLGNTLASSFGLTGMSVIGYHAIENSNKIIVFLTNGTAHYIYEFIPSNTANLLVTGSFLNFSLTKPITGISVIENLLFWTDYNNQPRKININEARNGTYYREENHISVAKYNPYQPIGLLNKVSKTTTGLTGAVLSIADTTGIKKGMSVVEYGNNSLQPKDYVYVESIVTNTSVTLNVSTATGVVNGDTIYFLETTMTGKDITYNFNNEAYNVNTWPGDPDYLESRFIRLSYRFEFDDGEYSLMAPFTPITFIPKQKGYFLSGDEDASYRSTIVEFMENGVQNIELLIPFPDTLNNIQPTSTASYKIRSLDILYKESDATAVKVIDTINYTDVNEIGAPWTATTNSNIYTYDYQSRKPFRTLPTNQTVRVYDKVPVKAFAQETAGNRIIYGNFLDKYSPPTFLNYILGVSPKSTSINYDSWAEFPTQSVKQNRNYQVGFVLADKFGRQSDVILSSVKTASVVAADGTIFGGDTVYAPYNTVLENTNNPIRDWFGDSLKIDISSPITSTTPGLYANAGTGYNTFQTAGNDQPTITGNTYVFKLGSSQTAIPTIGSYLPGEFTDYVYVNNVQPQGAGAVGTQYTVTTIGQVSSTYLQQSPANPDVKYVYSINPVGWYSYKIVVKQQEQDYYNVYLPGILNGYPQHGGTSPYPTNENGKTAHIVLFNDNINKVPRDLSEVGPQQKQFRSSVQLYARVENTMTTSVANNIQFYPGILTDTAITIGTATDLNMGFAEVSSNGQANFYQLDTDPLLARLDTSQTIGVISTNAVNTNMTPFLAIYETEPQDSLLDIFWETPTVGLISDLNDAIASNYTGAVGWSSYTSSAFTEASVGVFLNGISPVDQSGVNLINTDITRDNSNNPVITVLDANELDVTNQFSAARTGAGTLSNPYLYNFSKVGDDFVYEQDANIRNYKITTSITNLDTGVVSNPLQIDVELQNIIPLINSGNALPVINNNTGASGVIVDLSGVNGAIKNSLNQSQLQWSMTGGGVYFTINSSTGEITQTSAAIGTYNLIVTLKDANGTGLSSVPATQQVVVSSTAVGFSFAAGQADGNIAQVCPFNGSVAPTCGNITYYNTTRNSGTPQVGDVISTTEFTITFATRGFYSFDCGNGGGTSRRYFFIDATNDGVVAAVTTCP
tara:strand:+ start:213 stop:3728 length:3516 start_codon:yes stop_codon:yes gene_type:complete